MKVVIDQDPLVLRRILYVLDGQDVQRANLMRTERVYGSTIGNEYAFNTL